MSWDRGERGLAHHTLQEHAAGDDGVGLLAFELRLVLAVVERVQLCCEILAAKVVRERRAKFPQLRELAAALRDDLVFVLGRFGRLPALVVGSCQCTLSCEMSMMSRAVR